MRVTHWRGRKAAAECHQQFQPGLVPAGADHMSPVTASRRRSLIAQAALCLCLAVPVAAAAKEPQSSSRPIPHSPLSRTSSAVSSATVTGDASTENAVQAVPPQPQPALAKTHGATASSKMTANRSASAKDGAGNPAKDVVVTIRKGDTLTQILARQGIGPADRTTVLDALGDVVDPTALKVGNKVRLTIVRQNARPVVTALHLDTGQSEDLTVNVGTYANDPADSTADSPAAAAGRGDVKSSGSVKAVSPSAIDKLREASLPRSDGQSAGSSTDNGDLAGQFVVRHAAGIVGKSFRTSLKAVRLPSPLIDEVVLAFKYDSDARGALPQNASFSIIYEGVLQDGKFQEPQLRYAALNDGRKTHRIYRYQTDGRTTAFIHADGQGIAVVDLSKPLMIDAKITSPYGWRIHPVFGDRRFHEGVDFGAPKGTPVVATADGTVEDIGWRGNYGEYIRVRHDDHLETAYAHLAGFARGLRRGTEVKRGQIIGYVGRTGVATGPHLYYEVLIDGKQIDPMKAPPVVPVTLSGTQLAEFQKFVEGAPQE